MRRAAILAAAALAAVACSKHETALQGYIEGEYVRVAAPFAGTLVSLQAERGQAIEVGGPLFVLESENEDAAKREAEQNLRKAEAQAEVAAGLSEREWRRQLDLVSKGFVSQSKADEARSQRDADRKKVEQLQNDLATVQAGARPDEIKAAEAEAAAAKQSLAQADWKLRQKTVASTVDGVVTDTLFVRGEWVPAGSPVVSLLPASNVKVRFFVPETQLGSVKVGQRVSLACDGCGDPIDGAISFIAPQAEFTPPVIYSKDSRAKLVFLVEARPAAQDASKLHPGMPVDVKLP